MLGTRIGPLVALSLCACGRIDFASVTDGGNAGADDAGSTGDAVADGPGDPSLLVHITFDSGPSPPEATCVSCPTATTGPRGTGAAQFDGTQCLYVSLPASTQPLQITFSVWALRAVTADQSVFGKPLDGQTTANNTFELYGYVGGDLHVAASSVDVSQAWPAGVWHHFAGTYDGTWVNGFFDGVKIGTTFSGVPLMYTNDPLMIGCDRDVGTELSRFNGSIDDVRFYSRVLSDAEIAALAQ